MRRLSAFALCTVGGLLLLFAGAQYARGAVRQDEARSAWIAAQASAQVARARQSSIIPARFNYTMRAPVARLLIPKIGLDEIVLEGIDDDVLNGGPGHYPGSSLPGESGNAVISAHRDRHFSHLDEVNVGDTIRTEVPDRATTWLVISRRVVPKDSPALFRTSDATLTLTTCWPVHYLGPAPERLIITAKPVSRVEPQ